MSADQILPLQSLRRKFELRYGRPAEIAARAPGRVDLMGSHTDYNEGYVLTLPIDRFTSIMAARSSGDSIRIGSLNIEGTAEFPSNDPLRGMTRGWDSYIRGVVHVLRQAGYPSPGFDALIHGTIPIGGGLSSSASIECATAVLIAHLGGHKIGPVETARLCQRAENEIVGVGCGILDQYTSMLGKRDNALVLDCRHLTHQLARIPDGITIVICDTRAPRQLFGSEFGARRAQCEQGAAILGNLAENMKTLRDIATEQFTALEDHLPEVVRQRCRFIVEENQRVLELAAALPAGDRESIGRITADSFAGARDLFEITVPAMEAMFAAMTAAPGVIGARQAGGGFGGCMTAFVESGKVEPFCKAAAQDYLNRTGITPELYPVRPVVGAGMLEMVS